MSDGIPNPNYDPDYGKRGKANAFVPTLRMDLTEERLRELKAAGMSTKDLDEQLTALFRNVSVTARVRFATEAITVIETGQVLKNFQSGIAAIFELDDVLHLKLDTGDVVAVETYFPSSQASI